MKIKLNKIGISLFLLLITFFTNIMVVYAKQTKTIKESYNVIVGQALGNVLVYQSTGKLSPTNQTREGITLKNDTINGKYGLYLSGIPTKPGTITFSGLIDDNNTYDVTYTVTINVDTQTKTIDKTYNTTVDKDLGKILVYESTGKIGDVNLSRNGITLKNETVNGKNGLYLSGKPTYAGKVSFSGTVYDNNTYSISYSITINIESQVKTITQNYDAKVGIDLGNILVYTPIGQLDNIHETRNGITLQNTTINGKNGLYLTGTPTIEGTVTFDGIIVDNNAYKISFNITVKISDDAKTITKNYDATYGKALTDILVYEPVGKITNMQPSTQNGLTIKSDTINGKYGVYLSGTPTSVGVITFNGTFTDNNKTKVTYIIFVNVNDNNNTSTNKTITKTYNATINTDIGKILVYDPAGQLSNVSQTKNGITLKNETVNNKSGLYLSGKPTSAGTITFSGILNDNNTKVNYNIILNITSKTNSPSPSANPNASPKPNSNPSPSANPGISPEPSTDVNPTPTDTIDNQDEQESQETTNNEEKKSNTLINLIIIVGTLIISMTMFTITLIIKRKRELQSYQ